MEKKIPFIMSLASPFAKPPDGFEAKVEAYGMGLLSKWSPQQTILSHPVTGSSVIAVRVVSWNRSLLVYH